MSNSAEPIPPVASRMYGPKSDLSHVQEGDRLWLNGPVFLFYKGMWLFEFGEDGYVGNGLEERLEKIEKTLSEEMAKAYITQMANDLTSVWTTTPPPSPAPKNLLEMIRAAKEKLVKSQRYDDAKDLRDIERLLMEKLGNEPVVLNDIEAILGHVREAKNSAARAEEGVALTEERIAKLEKNPLANFVHISDDGQAVLDASMLPTFDVIVKSSDAFKNLEKALSEEMARTREMDGVLAGMVQAMATSSIHSPDFSAAPANADVQEQVAKDMARAMHGPGWYIDAAGDRHQMPFSPATLDQKTLDDIVANPRDYEVKMVTPVVDPELKFTTSGPCHTICIMPNGNPYGIPFSVALEYLKAGRQVRRPHWLNQTRVQPQGINGMGGLRMIYWASADNGPFEPKHEDLMATDWMVMPKNTDYRQP